MARPTLPIKRLPPRLRKDLTAFITFEEGSAKDYASTGKVFTYGANSSRGKDGLAAYGEVSGGARWDDSS